MNAEFVESRLKELNINHVRHDHPAVFTVEEAKRHCSHIPGLHCKNLLLCDRKKQHFFLVVYPSDMKVDLKVISPLKLSFAKADLLMEKLGLEAGAVSPFGLLNNNSKDIELILHPSVYHSERINFHPNVNTATLELEGSMFRQWLKSLDHVVRVLE